MNNFAIRRFSSSDSIDEITQMLHHAFAPMAGLGATCQCVDQSNARTRKRMDRGDCLVAVADRRVVGTLTLEAPDACSPIVHYRKPTVASLHQFAVDPAYQRGGVGRAMLKVAVMWARTRQYAELALDTPSIALDVRSFYVHQGFELVQIVKLADRPYESAVMSRPVAFEPVAQATTARRMQALAALWSDTPSPTSGSLH